MMTCGTLRKGAKTRKPRLGVGRRDAPGEPAYTAVTEAHLRRGCCIPRTRAADGGDCFLAVLFCVVAQASFVQSIMRRGPATMPDAASDQPR